jgi:RNase H-like domain found in reverse transcriptase
MQIGKERKLHPVTFYSKKMSPAEMNYDIYNKELLAVVTAFQKWKVYLKRAKHQVKIFTNY